jgi:hypothetical protein
MRRNSSTVVVLAGQVPAEVLAAARVLETARRFYPASLADETVVLAQ